MFKCLSLNHNQKIAMVKGIVLRRHVTFVKERITSEYPSNTAISKEMCFLAPHQASGLHLSF